MIKVETNAVVKVEVEARVPYLEDTSKLFVRGLANVNKIYVVTAVILIKDTVR